MELLAPDAATPKPPAPPDAQAFAAALDGIGAQLTAATRAEDAYANGDGSLQAAVYERARADVALAVATAAAQRGAQALNAVFNMQI